MLENVNKSVFVVVLACLMEVILWITIISKEMCWEIGIALMIVMYFIEKIFQFTFEGVDGKVNNFFLNNVFIILSIISLILINIKNVFKENIICNIIIITVILILVSFGIWCLDKLVMNFSNKRVDKNTNSTETKGKNENNWNIYEVKIKKI